MRAGAAAGAAFVLLLFRRGRGAVPVLYDRRHGHHRGGRGDAASDAACRAASDAASYAACRAAFDRAFANAWQPGGAAYVIVTSDGETYNDDYFRNLVNVLVTQIRNLKKLIPHHGGN